MNGKIKYNIQHARENERKSDQGKDLHKKTVPRHKQTYPDKRSAQQ